MSPASVWPTNAWALRCAAAAKKPSRYSFCSAVKAAELFTAEVVSREVSMLCPSQPPRPDHPASRLNQSPICAMARIDVETNGSRHEISRGFKLVAEHGIVSNFRGGLHYRVRARGEGRHRCPPDALHPSGF